VGVLVLSHTPTQILAEREGFEPSFPCGKHSPGIRSMLRIMVKRILRKYGYPPDKQDKATLTVLQQAEMIASNWAE